MSNYKLTAIYKQKLRCKLRNSNKFLQPSCLCYHCWVEFRLQPSSVKAQIKMKNTPVSHCSCDAFNKRFEKIEDHKTTAPLPPPPLPVAMVSDSSKISATYKSETVAEEIKRLWKNRELTVYGEEFPSHFAFIKLNPILQEGPNCGLAALAMAATATPRKLSLNELFIEAKSQNFTHQGEMFSACDMARLAKTVIQPWFTVEILSGGMSANYDYILRSLFEGALMLVPYDAAGNYAPCCKRGHKSHWAVVCGVVKVKGGDPDCYLYARQGKSRYMALWSYEELELSNKNLLEFDPKRAEDGTEYILPDGGVEAGLAGKMIMLHMIHRGPDFTSFSDLC
ncbi:actin maturation protease [Lycorma delicatula]|uniref:actin maturation protease n=1 Tax=Lycorma delicatula TaxID=130591 RepID=UPI003F5194F1